jgi:chromosomal replication initiation ATPase DnaA
MQIRIVPLSEALERRRRLRNPDNAVPDHGIDLPVVIATNDQMEIAQLKILDLKDALVASEKQSDARRQRIIHLESRLEQLTGNRIITVANIQAVVASAYGITVEDINSSCQKKEFSDPRHIAMYLAKTLTTHPAVALGRMFGDRDSTTVRHGFKKVERERLTDVDLDEKLRRLEQRFIAQTRTEDASCNSPPITAQ